MLDLFNFFEKKNIWFFLPDIPIIFDKMTAKCNLSKGWYMITYQILSESPFTKSTLIFFSNNNVIENGLISLPHNHGRVTKRLCHLNNKVNIIKFDPLENYDNTRVNFFSMSRVSEFFSRDRMLRKIRNKHPLYRGKSIDTLKLIVKPDKSDHRTPALRLYDLYKECCEPLLASGHDPFISNPSVALNSDGRLSHIIVDQQTAPPLRAPDISTFEGLNSSKATDKNPLIDVIIPVYKGYDDTLACIYSVLSSENNISYELIVINDCSPDNYLSQRLHSLSELGLITYLANRANLGFVGTVNRGMQLHSDRDVVLLNSDTEVYPGWLDRLAAHARRDRVSTVTPFSNNATICSYPYVHNNNNELLEIPYHELDSLCSKVNYGKSIEIPTAIGYCMYIKRDALNELGLFDHKIFNKGYGEENDFCMRALKKGYKNVFALDVFVRHTGEVSFGNNSQLLQESALISLLKKHPGYLDIVNNYISKDPGKQYRRLLDATRLKEATYGRSILYVINARKGGIMRYIRDQATILNQNEKGIIVLSPMIVNSKSTYINALEPLVVPNLCGLDLKDDMQELSDLIGVMGVESISVNSLVDWAIEIFDLIPELAECAGIKYDFVVHDYASICPIITMMNKKGFHCGDPDEKTCQKCLDNNAGFCGPVDIREWRKKYLKLFKNAHVVTAPSNDAVDRIQRFFPEITVMYRPHVECIEPLPAPVAALYQGDTIRIVVIGAINMSKGSNVLLACARDAYSRGLPLRFVIAGYTDMDGAFGELSNVEITGPYQEEEIYNILEEQNCHVAFFPAVCPETYCYTLSHALNGGFPCISFDIGAQAERLKREQKALIMDVKIHKKPKLINDSIMKFVREGFSGRKAQS